MQIPVDGPRKQTKPRNFETCLPGSSRTGTRVRGDAPNQSWMEITIPDLPDDGPDLFSSSAPFGAPSGTHGRTGSSSSANFQFPQAATPFNTPFGPVPAGSVAKSSAYPPLRNPFASSPSNSSSHGTTAESPELQQRQPGARRPSVASTVHNRTKSSASAKSHAHQSSSGEQSVFSLGGSHHGHAGSSVPPVPPLLKRDELSTLEIAFYPVLDKFIEKADAKIGDALARPVVSRCTSYHLLLVMSETPS
jgi:hypothetical protein